MLGDKIKLVRKRNNITRQKFSDDIHITMKYLYHIEKDLREPSYPMLIKILKELKKYEPELSLDWLLLDKEDTGYYY